MPLLLAYVDVSFFFIFKFSLAAFLLHHKQYPFFRLFVLCLSNASPLPVPYLALLCCTLTHHSAAVDTAPPVIPAL